MGLMEQVAFWAVAGSVLCGLARGAKANRAKSAQNGQSYAQVAKMMKGKKAVCVFMGSSAGNKPEYLLAAEELGRELAKKGYVLVYGGGNVGLMGAVARAHKQQGGTVVGIIPRPLSPREISGETPADYTIFTETMHERKAMMAMLSTAFIVLPGGYGTMEECVEVTTWTQLGIHRKPVGLLSICGFWDKMYEMFQYASSEGFIHPEKLDIIVHEKTVSSLLQKLLNHTPPKGLSKSWKSSLEEI